jgi:hypothetical protein
MFSEAKEIVEQCSADREFSGCSMTACFDAFDPTDVVLPDLKVSFAQLDGWGRHYRVRIDPPPSTIRHCGALSPRTFLATVAYPTAKDELAGLILRPITFEIALDGSYALSECPAENISFPTRRSG